MYIHIDQELPKHWFHADEKLLLVRVSSSRDRKIANRVKGDMYIDKHGKFKRFSGHQFVNICWQHRKRCYQCADCDGGGICVHKRNKWQCKLCKFGEGARSRASRKRRKRADSSFTNPKPSPGCVALRLKNTTLLYNGHDIPFCNRPFSVLKRPAIPGIPMAASIYSLPRSTEEISAEQHACSNHPDSAQILNSATQKSCFSAHAVNGPFNMDHLSIISFCDADMAGRGCNKLCCR